MEYRIFMSKLIPRKKFKNESKKKISIRKY